MKQIFLVLSLCVAVSARDQNTHIDKVATNAAQKYCNCVNTTYSFIDKDVAKLIIETG